ncbi:MAG: SDR family oxidoreductase [Actinobacteria bacterium]|nr:MAG: SDR family oxidoreductase [Actinomycetota bacterium]
MHRVRSGLERGAHVLAGVEVGRDLDGRICRARVQGAAVVGRDDRDGRQSFLAARAEDPQRDLAAVRHQDPVHAVSVASVGELDGKVAIVTGASRGIGAAVARALAAEGVRLGLGSRSGDDLGLNAVARRVDVRKRADLDRLVSDTVDTFGRLDILVANAGVGAYGPFLELSEAHVDEMIDVNLKGTIHAVRAALPQLLERGEGDIVAIASVAGLRAFPHESVYNASKFGQVGFIRSLDHELRERGIRCTCIAPGGVATDFALGEGRGRSEDVLTGMLTAEEVADVVVFALTRPRGMRILTTSFRPMTEDSWG